MAEDDFVGNLAKINNKTNSRYTFILMDVQSIAPFYPNLMKSISNQLKTDNVTNADVPAVTLKIERVADGWRALKIELFIEDGYGNLTSSQARQKTIIAYANRDGNTMNFYPFREVAKTEKLNLTLLNGWTISGEAAVAIKVGDFININFIATGGVKTSGTVIFELLENFRPDIIRTIPLLTENNTTWARIAIYPSGQGRLWSTDNVEGKIVCASGFSI